MLHGCQSTGPDTYETAKWSLDLLLVHVDPARFHIWEPFVGTGRSTAYMRAQGFEVTNGDHADFFKQTRPVASPGKTLLLVSNPPYSTKQQILEHLKAQSVLQWALLMPVQCLFCKYFTANVDIRRLSLVVHSARRGSFIDPASGEPYARGAPFEMCWFTQNLFDGGTFLMSAEPFNTRVMTKAEIMH
jgi:hypothetical protein